MGKSKEFREKLMAVGNEVAAWIYSLEVELRAWDKAVTETREPWAEDLFASNIWAAYGGEEGKPPPPDTPTEAKRVASLAAAKAARQACDNIRDRQKAIVEGVRDGQR